LGERKKLGPLGKKTKAGTPAELVPERIDPGLDIKAHLKLLRETAQATQDVQDMISVDQVAAGDSDAPESLALMKRAALAFCMECSEKKDGERNYARALNEAGVSQELYWEMVESPDWLPTLQWAVINTIVVPRYPAICMASTNMAMNGDFKSVGQWVEVMQTLTMQDRDDFDKRIRNLDETQFERELASVQASLTTMMADMSGADEARRDVEDAVARDDVLQITVSDRGDTETSVDQGQFYEEHGK